MSLRKSLLEGISCNFFAILLSRGLAFLVVILMVRNLDAGEFGLYSFLLAIAMMLVPVADFGVSAALQKYICNFQEDRIPVIIGCGFAGKLCSSFVIALIVLALDYWWKCFRGYGAYIALILFLSSFNLVIMSLNAELKFRQSALVQVLIEVVFAAMVFVLILSHRPITAVLVARGLSYLIIGLPFLVFVIKPQWVSVKSEFDIFCKIMKFGFWATVMALSTVVFSQSGLVILSLLEEGYESTAILKAAFAISTLVLVIPEIIRKPLLPVVSRTVNINCNEQDGQLFAMHRGITGILLLIFIPMLFLGIFFARHIITLIFGQEYLAAVFPFRILLVVNVLSAITVSYFSIFYMKDKVRTLVQIGVVCAIVSIVGNFLLIPRFGPTGAALASLTAQMVGTVWIITAFVKQYGFKHLNNILETNEVTSD